MATKVKRHGEMLQVLSRANPAAVKAIMKTASPELVTTLCECCHNILKGNVPLTVGQKRQLRRYKHNLRELILKKTSNKRRKEILQRGGFIGALLGPIVKVLTGILGV